MESEVRVCLDAKPMNASAANSSTFDNGSNNNMEGSAQSLGPQVPFNPKDKYYNMTGNKYLYIFNHWEYEKNCLHPNPEDLKRDGTLEDAKILKGAFEDLDFKTKVYQDLKHKEILSKMDKVCNMDHSATSCVVVAIMTHGHNGGILLAYDEPYYLKELTDKLENGHPSLVGKPKLCFVQACRSGHMDTGRAVLADNSGQNTFLPKTADILIMYSSTPHVDTARLVYFSYFHSIMAYGILLWGSAADVNTVFVLQKRAVRAIYNMGPRESLQNFVSYRFPGYGTWMMRYLSQVLVEHRQDFDLLQMLTLVNQAVSNDSCYIDIEQGKGKNKKMVKAKVKQMPEIQCRLTKLLKIN